MEMRTERSEVLVAVVLDPIVETERQPEKRLVQVIRLNVLGFRRVARNPARDQRQSDGTTQV